MTKKIVLIAAGGTGGHLFPAAAFAEEMFRRGWRVVLLFGLIALCSAYGEGAIGDWGALHLRQDLGVGPGLPPHLFEPGPAGLLGRTRPGLRLLRRGARDHPL